MLVIIAFFSYLMVFDVSTTTITKLRPCTTPDVTGCQVVQYYTDYQQMKCLTTEQIKVLGKGQFVCEDKNCWYHDCQMRLTDLAFERTVRPQCKCIEESRNYCENAIDAGKMTCMKLERYETAQFVTCWRSQDLLMKTHTTGCHYPQTHCWFPCQSEKHHLESGRVSDECKCNDSRSLFTKWNAVLTILLSIVVTLIVQ